MRHLIRAQRSPVSNGQVPAQISDFALNPLSFFRQKVPALSL